MSWAPDDFESGIIDLTEVQQTVLAAHRHYNLAAVWYDPWQAQLLAQQLIAQGVPMVECVFNPANKDLMARSLLEAFTNKLIRLYHDEPLIREPATHPH